MTLPPSKLGDKGQRYVVQATGYPKTNIMGWQDIAYTNDHADAQEMFNGISQAPSVKYVRILDRSKTSKPPEDEK